MEIDVTIVKIIMSQYIGNLEFRIFIITSFCPIKA